MAKKKAKVHNPIAKAVVKMGAQIVRGVNKRNSMKACHECQGTGKIRWALGVMDCKRCAGYGEI